MSDFAVVKPECESSLKSVIAKPDSLLKAWEVVRGNDAVDGVINTSTERFSDSLMPKLQTLSDELLHGTYKPCALRRVEIPKPHGGKRTLHIPAVRDRIVERAVTVAIQPRLDRWFSPWSFAYRPGLGVGSAIGALVGARERGMKWAVRADIRDCFDNLDRTRLLLELSVQIHDVWLNDLVAQLLARHESSSDGYVRKTTGAPQGSPLSPLLCNLVLNELDEALITKGHIPIRYADDMVIPAESQERAIEALHDLKQKVGEMRMSLANEKVEVMAFEEGFSFLGESINALYPLSDSVEMQCGSARTLFVAEQGAGLRAHNGQVIVHKDHKERLRLPTQSIGRIALYGNVGLSAGLRSHCLYYDVPVLFLSRRGRFLGSLSSTVVSDVAMRRAQFECSSSSSFRLGMARSIVEGKIANQRALLMRYHPDQPSAPFDKALESLASARFSVQEQSTVEGILGVEGSSSRSYFEAFAELLKPEFDFPGRKKHPSVDPVNAALSFGYSLLRGEMAAAISVVGLDVMIGFLHGDDRDRDSLSFDLMEEFRPLIVDTVVLEVFRRNVLNEQDFHKPDDKAGLYLKDEARRKFLAAIEERLITVFTYVPTGNRISYRRALYLQAQQIARCIRDGVVDYHSVSWR